MFWKLENLKTWKFENFENMKNDPWDMLNNFCFHVYAQKSLFIIENVNAFFYHSHLIINILRFSVNMICLL